MLSLRAAALISVAGLAGGWIAPTPAHGRDLVGPSFRMRGAHTSTLAARALVSSGPRFSSSGAALGQGDALGFSGSSEELETSAPGFWPIVAGALPHLDPDGDGLPAWLDDDDDDDGLLDVVETNTGSFGSGTDTGTDPTNPDSDGDGVDDGQELLAGTDPTDADSTPQIPLAPIAGLVLLALALAGAPRIAQRRLGGRR